MSAISTNTKVSQLRDTPSLSTYPRNEQIRVKTEEEPATVPQKKAYDYSNINEFETNGTSGSVSLTSDCLHIMTTSHIGSLQIRIGTNMSSSSESIELIIHLNDTVSTIEIQSHHSKTNMFDGAAVATNGDERNILLHLNTTFWRDKNGFAFNYFIRGKMLVMPKDQNTMTINLIPWVEANISDFTIQSSIVGTGAFNGSNESMSLQRIARVRESEELNVTEPRHLATKAYLETLSNPVLPEKGTGMVEFGQLDPESSPDYFTPTNGRVNFGEDWMNTRSVGSTSWWRIDTTTKTVNLTEQGAYFVHASWARSGSDGEYKQQLETDNPTGIYSRQIVRHNSRGSHFASFEKTNSGDTGVFGWNENGDVFLPFCLIWKFR